jgi:hypothetical protein
MQARDRYLPDWFARIRSRQITLPRFQRFVAWGHTEVSGLLTTVLRGLPSGAALILEVGDREKFISRTMTDAPADGQRVVEQLLDGQQRLTALWRSLNDKFPDRTYLVNFEADSDAEGPPLPSVSGWARWTSEGARFPMWVDRPSECWRRGYIPLRLLRPEDMEDEIDRWIEEALPDDAPRTAERELRRTIQGLRTKVREFNLPYLALPSTTAREVALDVFVKMNTSSVKLTTYDIVVALVEDETGRSLHDHVAALSEACPRAQEYADLPGLILDVAALRQDRSPTQVGYKALDYRRMVDEWGEIQTSVGGMIAFVEEECIFDAQRLPSYTPLPVIAALWQFLPTQPDALGNARTLLKKYLWRAFLTSRYEQASATAAFQDFRALRACLSTNAAESTVPILNAESFPAPAPELIAQAAWPRGKSILGRGLLGLQIKCGALDFADGRMATVQNITSNEHPREYHHLFPDSLLSDAGVPDEQIYRAANCALITWRTNRALSDKDPVRYLKERSESATLGEPELRARLRSHLIPYERLAVGYETLDDATRRVHVQRDYGSFCSARARVLAEAARQVCSGAQIDIDACLAKRAEPQAA